MTAFHVFILLVLTVGQSIAAPFRNLGFDEAITNNIRYLPLDPFEPDAGVGPPGELVPGWDLFGGRALTTQVTTVAYNVHSLGRPGVPDNYFSIISRDHNPYVEGPFSLLIVGATSGLLLSQEGDIPRDAKFLTFRNVSGDNMVVTIDGDSFFPAFDRVQNTAWVDISPYAGRDVRISFYALSPAYIDSIAFIVPEPASYALFGVGALVLLLPAIRRRIIKSYGGRITSNLGSVRKGVGPIIEIKVPFFRFVTPAKLGSARL